MAVFNEPTKWQTSLVNSGDANVIPQSTPAGTGEASFEDGFPPITQVPIGAGGQAPNRKDFNGLFKILGDWIFFNQNGGVPSYNADYDYIAGRVVSYNDNIYKCIQANGVSSTVAAPDSDTTYWQRIDNFVRSVNGVDADTSGNVTITNDYTVSLKSTRTTTGTWTITGLTPYKPLIIIYNSVAEEVSCYIKGVTNCTTNIKHLALGEGVGIDNYDAILIPTSSNVSITLAEKVTTASFLVAYQ